MKKLSDIVAGHQFAHIFSDHMVHFGDQHDWVVEVVCNTGNPLKVFESGYYWADRIIKSNISISSMVGCPMRCNFCELGGVAFDGHLSPEQMYEQVILTLAHA